MKLCSKFLSFYYSCNHIFFDKLKPAQGIRYPTSFCLMKAMAYFPFKSTQNSHFVTRVSVNF